MYKLQYYLSVKHDVVKNWLLENGGTLKFQDCIPLSKNSIVRAYYIVYEKFEWSSSEKKLKKGKLPELKYEALSKKEVQDFIFENAVVLYELNSDLDYDFFHDKATFRICAQEFIEHTYKSIYYNEVDKSLRFFSIKTFYDFADKYYKENINSFHSIAVKRSRLNKKKRGSTSRYDTLTITKKQKSKRNHMYNLQENVLNECFEKYYSKELRTFKECAEYYQERTGEPIKHATLRYRMIEIGKRRGVDLRKFIIEKDKKKNYKTYDFDNTRIPVNVLETVIKMNSVGVSIDNCYKFIQVSGCEISRSTLYNMMNSYKAKQAEENERKSYLKSLEDAEIAEKRNVSKKEINFENAFNFSKFNFL